MRLNDEKRRLIKVWDTIEFIKVPEQDETLEVKVKELRMYDTFKEMYEDIPFKDFDCKNWTMAEMIDGTYEIYTLEQEKNGEH
ncbi:ASCH domain-containing protein [Desemzia sp. FAM 23991]|uniref:ASCH domain-containing protein n=1 Tax=unclassified Desemzia TaxID=2685243 RepID=UPI003884972C